MVTNLNMLLQMRRDNVFNTAYVLQPGEPGFEISTNTLKIGDGTKTWAQLDIANKAAIDALIKVVDDKVAALDGNYATDAELEAIRKALQDAIDALTLRVKAVEDDLKEGGATYGKIAAVEAKFADYKTAEAQKAIDDEQDRRLGVIEDDYLKAADIANFETKENVKKVADALENITKDGGTIDSKISAFKTASVDPIAAAVEDITKEEGLLDQLEAAYIAADAVVAGNAASDATAKANAAQAAAEATAAADATAKADKALSDAKAYVDEEDKFSNGITTVNALGGIAANTSLDGKTTHEILDMLLFPYVAFSITSSSRSAAAATLENGAEQTLSSCSITVAKKSKPITSITLYNGSTVLETKTGDAVANGGTITFNGFDAITVNKSNNPNLKFTVTDGQTSTDRNVGASTFVYPYYWGVCAADATIDEALVESLTKSVSSKGNKTDIKFNCTNQRQVFAYPKAHGVLKSIIDPNNFEIIGDFTRSEVSITGLDGTAQTYYVYVSGASTVADFLIDFKY